MRNPFKVTGRYLINLIITKIVTEYTGDWNETVKLNDIEINKKRRLSWWPRRYIIDLTDVSVNGNPPMIIPKNKRLKINFNNAELKSIAEVTE